MSIPTSPDQIPQADIDRAKHAWAYFPFRRCWLAYPPDGTEAEVVLKPSTHAARNRAKRGYQVFELTKG